MFTSTLNPLDHLTSESTVDVSSYMQTGRNLPEYASAHTIWQTVYNTDLDEEHDERTTISDVSNGPLTSAYQIFSYESGNCFVESNVNYESTNADDDFAHYFTYSFEKCCSDCNRLSICLSWTFEQEGQICTLKRAFRPNPTLVKRFISGFKPSELFSLSITRGLQFLNVNSFNFNTMQLAMVNVANSSVSIIVKAHIEDEVNAFIDFLYIIKCL